jgi:hypothetical protein
MNSRTGVAARDGVELARRRLHQVPRRLAAVALLGDRAPRIAAGAFVAVLLAVAFPMRGQAVEVHLIGRDLVTGNRADESFAGAGCGSPGAISVRLPSGSHSIAPDALDSVGTYVPGPWGFIGKDSVGIDHYAQITAFSVQEASQGPLATFYAEAASQWCAGWVGEPSEGAPQPVSEIENPQLRPGYHGGWRTANATPIADYVLTRAHLYSIDPKSHIYASPPTTLAISKHWPLVARRVRWRQWGHQEATGFGTLRFRGQALRVKVQLYNTELGGDPEGLPHCTAGNAYYEDFAVEVPAWHRATTYRLDQRCHRAFVDNGAGDLRPPG